MAVNRAWFTLIAVFILGATFFNCSVGDNEYLIAFVNRSDIHIKALSGPTGGWMRVQSQPRQNLTSFDFISHTVADSIGTVGGIEDKAIQVKSDDDLSVYGSIEDEEFNSLPVQYLGTKYIILSFVPVTFYTYQTSLVIATYKQEVDIDISFSGFTRVQYDGTWYEGGDTLTKTLREYQTFTVHNVNGGFTGTVVNASGNIAVFAATIFKNSLKAYEQLLPVQHFGQEYVVAVGDIIGFGIELQIISEHNDTQISFNDGSTASVDSLGHYRTWLEEDESIHLTTTKPVMATLSDYRGLLVVPPVDSYIKQTALDIFDNAKIITDKDATDIHVRSSSNLNISVEWKEVAGTRYKVGTFQKSTDNIFLRSDTSNFTVLVYSATSLYNGGFYFDVDNESERKTTDTVCINATLSKES